jgi:hypothetical protein
LELKHKDICAALLKQYSLFWCACFARMDCVAAIHSANVRAAHPHDEQRDRDDNAKENSEYDVDGYGENSNHHNHQQIKQYQAATGRRTHANLTNEIERPRIKVLNRDYHDSGREHDARYVAHDREENTAHQKQNSSIDQNGKPSFCAESAVGDTRPDVYASCNAAETGRQRIANAEAHQESVSINFLCARWSYELGAKERIDSGDNAECESAGDDEWQQFGEVSNVQVADGLIRGGTFHCTWDADDRPEMRTQPGEN